MQKKNCSNTDHVQNPYLNVGRLSVCLVCVVDPRMIFHEAAYLHTVSCGTLNCQEEEEEEAPYQNKFCVDLKILYIYSLDLLRSRSFTQSNKQNTGQVLSCFHLATKE
jgi:hypothetical protein